MMLTVAEACELLKCSRATLYRQRQLRFTKPLGRRLYYRADIELLLALNVGGH